MEIPNLQIRSPYGDYNKFSLNLERYLYVSGASHDAQWVHRKIENGELGVPKTDRIEILLAIKEEMETRFISGCPPHSIKSYMSEIKLFFVFLEEYQLPFSLKQLVANYLTYSEHLFMESHQKSAQIKKTSCYNRLSMLSTLFGAILSLPREELLIARIRMKRPSSLKKSVSRATEKQNLEETFKLGNFLVFLIAGLSTEAILGTLPLIIPIREGLVENDYVRLTIGLKDHEWLSKPKNQLTVWQKDNHSRLVKARAPVDRIEGTRRWELVNMRVCAEFLVFIAQTGMNLTQAKELERSNLKYKSVGDSWYVRCYKNRKGGEVTFNIYKSYKPYFEKYQAFINYFFPDSKNLFPLALKDKLESTSRSALSGRTIRNLALRYGIPWVPARVLRNTRVNWLLRRSGDEDLTAEMVQHTREMLRDRYERPSQQRAVVEITRFWNKYDPITQGDLVGSVISSQCNGKPEATVDKPSSTVEPNCVNQTGCLWCKHHRDVDTFDYVWSLASMRHLKSIEASLTLSQETVPADLVIERLSTKLNWFKSSNPQHAQWVIEAEDRVEEGEYHPNWCQIIGFLE